MVDNMTYMSYEQMPHYFSKDTHKSMKSSGKSLTRIITKRRHKFRILSRLNSQDISHDIPQHCSRRHIINTELQTRLVPNILIVHFKEECFGVVRIIGVVSVLCLVPQDPLIVLFHVDWGKGVLGGRVYWEFAGYYNLVEKRAVSLLLDPSFFKVYNLCTLQWRGPL